MIIAVDIGNSNIVIGGIQDDHILFEARLRTDATKTSDEYCIDLKMIFDIHRLRLESIHELVHVDKPGFHICAAAHGGIEGPTIKIRLGGILGGDTIHRVLKGDHLDVVFLDQLDGKVGRGVGKKFYHFDFSFARADVLCSIPRVFIINLLSKNRKLLSRKALYCP